MKVMITVWDNRVAPVFDAAGQSILLDCLDGNIMSRLTHNLPQSSLQEKIDYLTNQQLDVLICGAISRAARIAILQHDITVIPFIAGDIDEVIAAWFDGILETEKHQFVMPGCHGSARCCRKKNSCNRNHERSKTMPARDGTGPQGQGAGTGHGQGNRPDTNQQKSRQRSGRGRGLGNGQELRGRG